MPFCTIVNQPAIFSLSHPVDTLFYLIKQSLSSGFQAFMVYEKHCPLSLDLDYMESKFRNLCQGSKLLFLSSSERTFFTSIESRLINTVIMRIRFTTRIPNRVLLPLRSQVRRTLITTDDFKTQKWHCLIYTNLEGHNL